MHACSTESGYLIDVDVESNGGAIVGRVGTSLMASPCRAEIEKIQEEIRLEIDCREERLRELEFLEKGGDPLDFKLCLAVSVSVQSTSLTDQQPDQIVTSQPKDSCESSALQLRHEETVDSFGKLGDTTCEAKSGDNHLLFDCESQHNEDKNVKSHDGKSTIVASEISEGIGGNEKARESENSVIFRPYARRNRSKSNRDGARMASVDLSHSRNQGSLQFHPGSTDLKGSVSDANREDPKLPSTCELNLSNRISGVVQNNGSSENLESVGVSAAERPTIVHGSCKELASDTKSNRDLLEFRKDPEKSQDAGIEADETTEVANCASRPSDGPTKTQKTGTASKSYVLTVPNEINYPHLDSTAMNLVIQNSKSDEDRPSNRMCENTIEQSKELILVNNEIVKAVTEDQSDTNISPELVDTDSAVIFDDIMHCMVKNSSVIKVEEDPDIQNKSATSEFLKKAESKVNEDLQVKKDVDNMIDRNSSPITDVVEVQISTLDKTISCSGVTTDKDVPDKAFNKKLTDKMDEDSVLAEAKIILAKRKRIAEFSMKSSPSKNCQKCHWDFLLEEVAWLANDFMQERVWKVTAAAQLVRHSALSFHQRHHNQVPIRRLKFVAYSLAKAVMEFWHTCECDKLGAPDSLEPQSTHKSVALKSYTLRFLSYNNSTTPSVQVEDPVTSDMHDLGADETSGESCIADAEDILFYVIPSGAMQCYRTSIESYVSQFEKNGNMQKEDDAPIDTIKMSKNSIHDEGETSLQYLPGTVEWSKESHFPHRKQKGLKRTYSSGSYELGADLAYGNRAPGTQKSVLKIKQSATQNLVSIPMKRMRTALTQRVLGSSNGVGAVNMLAMDKTDASSEDTNSYQDDQGSLRGGSQIQRSFEVESPVDYENYIPTDSEEVSTKPKKRRKDKHMGDHSKKRLESHHLGSNGGNGLLGHHKPKKLKLSKQTFENLLENGGPISGSVPSPAASQISNMSSANEYKRIIAYSDHFKKAKCTKLPISLAGSCNAWTSFEDQALVVLVHDLGPNWDLVSDAINSTLQVKHIFRAPNKCKERHKLLMDQTASDAADSADDSGSSQPYPSTMPGIPKGSARQLFQRLHGPMEEDLVKSHFEKLIMIGQRQYHRRKQFDSQDQKHVAPPHKSQLIAISQASSNNMNGGFLTPLDLIDAIMSSPDALAIRYQCPQTNGFTNQSCAPPVLPPPGMTVGNSLASPSGPNANWNGRYRVSMPSLPLDDQQRVQQTNSLLSGRNIQQSTTSVPGPQPLSDHFGSRKFQGINGMGMVNGISNRGKPMSRPGFQGLGSSPMPDPAAVLSSGMVGLQTLDMQSNSMHRHMENSHLIGPAQSLEYHRQKLVPNSHSTAPSNGLNGGYSSQTGSSSGQSYSAHPQQKHQKSLKHPHDLTYPHLKGPGHAIGSQHPAYIRLVKERQLQQQIFEQKQQNNASNAMIPQAQQQKQLPVPMQNSSQVQPQSSQGVSLSSQSPSSPVALINSQLKHHLPPHVLPRDSQSGPSSIQNQTPKQRQRHPH